MEEALSFEAYIKDVNFSKTIQRMEWQIENLSKKTQIETRSLDLSFSRLGLIAASAFAGLGLAQLPAQIIRVRGEFERLEISLRSMLQSQEQADQLMNQIIKVAAETPFSVKDLADAAKQLIAYGSSASTVTDEIRMLGNVASGVSVPLGQLIYLYGTLRSQGRAYAVDIRQFAGRGIPIYAELAKVMGVSVDQINNLVKAGKVGFPQVEQAFKNMTSAGGMFHNLNEELAKSIPGQIERLREAFDLMLNDIGKDNEGLIKSIISGAATAVQNYETIIDILKILVAGYGGYKAALIATWAWEQQAAVTSAAKRYLTMAQNLGAATAAQKAFNAAAMANPYVLVGAAVAALAGGYLFLSRQADHAAKISDQVNEATNRQISKISALNSIINETNASQGKRAEKLKELISLSPDHLNGLTLENAATAEGKRIIDEYTNSLKRKIELQVLESELIESMRREANARSGRLDIPVYKQVMVSMLSVGGPGLYAQGAANMAKNTIQSAIEEELNLQKTIKKRIGLLSDVTEAAKSIPANPAGDGKASAPFGSIEYWEKIAKNAKEILNKTPGLDTEALSKQQSIIQFAEQEIEDIRKSYAIRSFDEEIEYKKQQYELYERWVQQLGNDTASAQFAGLLDGGKSFADYLQSEIARLGAMDTPDFGQIEKLKSVFDEVTGAESPIDRFRKQLEAAKEAAGNLTDYLEYLDAVQNGLASDTSPSGYEKRSILGAEAVAVQKELRDGLKQLLLETNVSGAKRLLIEKKYIDIRLQAEKESSDEELQDRLKGIEKAKQAELDALLDNELEQKDRYKRIYQEYLNYGRKEIKERLENIQQVLKQEELSAAKRKELEMELAKTRQALSKDTTEGIREAAGILSGVLGDVELNFSENFKISLQQLSSAMNNVANLMDDSASTTSQVGSIIGLVSFAITSARDAMLSAEDLYTEMDDQISYYQEMTYQLEGINILLSRQKQLLDDLTGIAHAEGSLALYAKYAERQAEIWAQLQGTDFQTIKSQQEVFVDPVFGTEIKNKGFWGWWTQLATGGQVKTKIRYEFESIDTSGFDDIEDYRNLLAEIKTGGGKLYGHDVVEADIQALETLIDAYDEAVAEQKAIMEELGNYFTGTTSTAIADAVVEGLKAGKQSAADFADTFEELMINAIINSFKANIITQGIQQWYDKFQKYSLSGFELTPDEIEELKNDWNSMATGWGEAWENIQDITGMDMGKYFNNQSKALTGIQAGPSEETATLLVGQMNAIRIHQADMSVNIRQVVLHLVNIEYNTSFNRHLVQLEEMARDLKTLAKNSNTRGYGL